MYQRIFVPVDNSEASFQALTEACKLAEVSGGSLRIVHVANMGEPGWGNTDFVPDSAMQQVADDQSEILLQAKQLAQSFNVPSECKVLKNWVDKIPDVLAEDARSWQADLIVMNTHGWTGLKRLLLGSVAEGVLRASTIPTLLIRTSDDR